ncbi:MAG: methionyl-tRNA formyltransferase, partial [Clostridia bacterium]|nr:methionyl-tRNA formyltransferase [Clostridia bacterium]
MGTPDFAVEPLKRICDAGHNVSLVVTQPDKQRGRGMAFTPTPVKAFATERGIKVFQPQSLKDEEAQSIIKAENADYIIVAAYGKILPKAVLDAAKGGCVNIHASLLPRHRGAAPINRAIMEGDTKGGVTVMHMAEGLDTGDMILVREMDIPNTMTAGEYHDALSVLGAEAICQFLSEEEHTRTPQDDSLATYAVKIEKSEAEIDFSADAVDVYNKIRGLSPYPSAFAVINGRRFKLISALLGNGKGEAGSVISATDKGIEIACGGGSVIITTIQPEGKRAM